MKKRNLIIIVVIALVLAAGAYGIVQARQRSAANSSDLITYQIGIGDLSAEIDETGEVRANQSATLFWETTGVVGEIEVELGEKVEADQVLATLKEDSLPQSYFLAQQELINAKRALEDLYDNAAETAAKAQSAVANARDALDKAEYRWTINQPGNRYSPEALKAAKARVVIAEKRLEKRQNAYNKASGKVGKAQAQLLLTDAIDQYQYAVWYLNWLQAGADEIEMAILDANVAVSQADLDSAERYYEKVKDGPDPDDIAIAEARVAAAQASVDTAEITAPFEGYITAIEITEGDLVTPSTYAFRIDSLDNLLVDVAVSEVDINQIKVGQPVSLDFDAIQDEEYQGEVTEVSPIGVQQQGLVSFEVTIKLLDADQEVRPGLTAAVQIVVRQVEDALLIPTRAVRWVRGEQVVYLSTTGETATADDLQIVPVTVGASSDEFTEVVDGDLKEGDYVVLNPPSVSIFDEIEPGQGPPSQFR